MTMIKGRQYVLFDPEQTAEVKRRERQEDIRLRIERHGYELLKAIDQYALDYPYDRQARRIGQELSRKILFLAGCQEDYEIEDEILQLGIQPIKFNREGTSWRSS